MSEPKRVTVKEIIVWQDCLVESQTFVDAADYDSLRAELARVKDELAQCQGNYAIQRQAADDAEQRLAASEQWVQELTESHPSGI